MTTLNAIKPMKRLELADQEVIRIAIQQEVGRTSESRYQHRLMALLLISSGQSCQEVAALFGENRRTIQRWVGKFETDGLDGLRDAKREGRPASLDERQMDEIKRDFAQGPPRIRNRPRRWNAKLLAQHLNSKYDVSLGIRQCQRIFRILEGTMRGSKS